MLHLGRRNLHWIGGAGTEEGFLEKVKIRENLEVHVTGYWRRVVAPSFQV